jgi:rhamnulokinase
MGAEIPGPVINDNCWRFNFTNEGGVGGTIRLLKNIGGLWLVQECRRVWALAGRDYGWDALTKMAARAKPLVSLVDPDDPSLTAPSDMPEAIRAYCRQTRQQVPESEGAVIRCALESLAMRYRLVLGWLEKLTGGPIQTIHIVGGGTNNQQLCQMTADSCNRHVVAGPVEATAIGNVLMQAIAMGDVDSIAQARDVLKASFAVQEYQPSNPAGWDEPFARFEMLARG